jgi:hypothetical protein
MQTHQEKILSGQVADLTRRNNDLIKKINSALNHNKNMLKCVVYYREIAADREGADPEKAISKNSMVDLFEELVKDQQQFLM